MYGRLFQLGVGLVVVGMLSGCHMTPPAHPKDQRDPLCNSKKPIEGRASDVTPEMVRIDPPPPPIPNQPGSAVVRQRVPLGPPQAGSE